MKLRKNLMKIFLKPKKTRAMAIKMSEICQFTIINILDYFNQLTIVMEIIQIVCNSNTDKTLKKLLKFKEIRATARLIPKSNI